LSGLKVGVTRAIEGLRKHFATTTVDVWPSANGAAFVIVADVPLGPPYAQESTWVGFFLSTACPDDDVYPFYVRGDLSRLDGTPLKTPLHINRAFPEVSSDVPVRSAVMVSRRQNNPASLVYESPTLKLITVLQWMLKQ
jgi:hypothetical protein